MDIRYSHRVPLDCPLIFLGDHIVGQGRMVNISAPGCAVDSTTSVLPGNYFALKVHMPDHSEPMVIALAAVRWAIEGRVGLELIRMGAGHQERLRSFLKKRRISSQGHREGAQPTYFLGSPS